MSKKSNPLIAQLMSSLPKGSKIALLSESTYGDKDVMASTPIPIMNLMLSGSINGGIVPGITQMVGDSRTFKSNYCLVAMAAFLNADPDAVAIFFDSEFGAKQYFNACGVDGTRVIHVPVTSVEEAATQITNMINTVQEGQKVFIFLDSASQLASRREINNAVTANEAADLTRAKALNSLFRIITPELSLRSIPFWFINSYYEDMANKYAEKNIKGGKQALLSSDVLLFVSRSQEKGRVDGKDTFIGFNFNYTIMKSRFIKEKSKFSVTVTFDGGIDKWSGLLDIARDGGFIDMVRNGYYKRTPLIDGLQDDKQYTAKQMLNDEFWNPILASDAFRKYLQDTYSITHSSLIKQSDKISYIDVETGEIIEEE